MLQDAKNSRRPSMNTGKDDVLRSLFASQAFIASFYTQLLTLFLISLCGFDSIFWFLWLVYWCVVVRTLLHQYSLLFSSMEIERQSGRSGLPAGVRIDAAALYLSLIYSVHSFNAAFLFLLLLFFFLLLRAPLPSSYDSLLMFLPVVCTSLCILSPATSLTTCVCV